MIFQAGADDLLAVVEILGADEADDSIDQKRFEGAGDGVGAGFDGLLVDAVMGVGGQCSPLPRLEIHDVVADGAALQRQRRVVGFAQDAEVDAETGVGGFRAGDGLEHQVDRGAAADDLQRVGDMGQDAGLGGNIVPQTQRFQCIQQGDGIGDAVGGGVHADDRIAAAQQQPVDRCGADAAQVVGGVVRLQAGTEMVRAAPGCCERRWSRGSGWRR